MVVKIRFIVSYILFTFICIVLFTRRYIQPNWNPAECSSTDSLGLFHNAFIGLEKVWINQSGEISNQIRLINPEISLHLDSMHLCPAVIVTIKPMISKRNTSDKHHSFIKFVNKAEIVLVFVLHRETERDHLHAYHINKPDSLRGSRNHKQLLYAQNIAFILWGKESLCAVK